MAERPRSPVPTLRHERELLRGGGHLLVAGVDEVGRGALAGPVTVGVVVVDLATRSAPTGLRDSKLLTPAAREALVPRLRRWAPAWAVGHAQAAEVDALGILRALRLAGSRALHELHAAAAGPQAVLLDGNYDWLGRPEAPPGGSCPPLDRPPHVTTLVKGDLRCAAVAAASVLAKVERDAIMTDLAGEHPGYGWAGNKGYSAPDHLEALRERGPCDQHRRSWRLPGVAVAGRAALSEQLELLEALEHDAGAGAAPGSRGDVAGVGA